MSQTQDAYSRALLLARDGRLDAALAELGDAAIAGDARALGLKGTLLSMAGRAAEALACFEPSIALNPRQPAVHADMGSALVQLDRHAEAVECFGRALAIDPDYLVAINNRAGQYLELREPEKALADAERALALSPGLNSAERNRSRALIMLRRFDEALAAIEAVIARQPGGADNHAIRAAVLDTLGRFDEAMSAYDRAVSLAPGDDGILNDRALARIRKRDFRGGWADYEHRWGSKVFVNPNRRRKLARLPRFDLNNSRADVAGKRVLVISEQGVGDEIMFAGALPDLAADAASVTYSTEPRLQSLFEQSFPGVRVEVGFDHLDLTSYDRIIPIGSLGHIYRNASTDFPGQPYMRPRPETVDAWRRRLGPKTTPLRIGIAWRGGFLITGADFRSVSLEQLDPLLTRSDCEFVSLQYGKVQADIAEANARLPRPIRLFAREETENFEHQAGLVLALDAVISVQQTLVHLSGAVGATCLTMLPYVTEWRYGVSGETMPWYGPSVRLIRQTRPGDWAPVLAEAGARLDRLSLPAG